MATSIFDFDKALEAVKNNPFAKDLLNRNKERLMELGTEAGQQTLEEIIALFAASKNAEAWRKFYGKDASWDIMGQGAAEDVTNTADMAQRWYQFGENLKTAGLMAAKALLSILVAGFLG